MFLTKDAQAKAVRDVEQFKTDRNELMNRKVCLFLEEEVVLFIFGLINTA